MSLDSHAATLLQQAAQAAAGGQHYPASTLYVVATPIGNLADLSLRALHVLGLVDAVACEDTRVSAVLLQHLGLRKPLLSVHDHNEARAAEAIMDRLARGERIAYISDAGTPALSDPGAVLVACAHARGLRVMPVPGASSALAALSVAGDVDGAAGATGGFHFRGFLPAKGQERALALAEVAASRVAVVLFEAPHRIDALAQGLAEACPTRPVTLCRELTKQFEQIHTLACAALPEWLAAESSRRRGEFALVLHTQAVAAAAGEGLAPDVERLLQLLLEALPLKQAVGLAAQATGASRNLIYSRALVLRQARDTPAAQDD